MEFRKATKRQAKLRLALIGPPGSGKTYSGLTIATNLGQRVGLIDTEHGSASKYADLFSFEALELGSFHPKTYIEAIRAAERAGFDVLVVDSLSHAWSGKDGALEQVDRAAARSKSGNSFAAWREVTPLHNELVEALVGCKTHLIVTMRSKVEWVLDEDDRGKKVPRKVGMAPVQRDGVEYEFDVCGDLDQSNRLVISKSRCPAPSGGVFTRPGKDVADVLRTWLDAGEAPPATEANRSDAPASLANRGSQGRDGKTQANEKQDGGAAAQATPDDDKPGRIAGLARQKHEWDHAEYIAEVLDKLGRKYKREFQRIEDIPLDEQLRWLEALESHSAAGAV